MIRKFAFPFVIKEIFFIIMKFNQRGDCRDPAGNILLNKNTVCYEQYSVVF